jgi:protoporphyrinogen oxidase
LKTVIIGAGFAGMAAAHRLKKDYLILEKNLKPGGLCRTEIVNGFTFDYTGHFLHIRKKETQSFISDSVKVPMEKISRKSFIYSRGVYTGYPYQVNNYGLPYDVVGENLTGFIRAKMKGPASEKNFREWVLTALGKGIAENFMLPYNSKLWRYPLDKLTVKWLGRFVPNPGISEIMHGILPKGKENVGYNAFFYYPRFGGIESVITGIFQKVKKNTLLGCRVNRIDLKNKNLHYDSGHVMDYENIISTMPLKELLKVVNDRELNAYAKKLKATSVYSLNVGFKKRGDIGKHWVYVPEKEYPFYRIGFPSEVVESNVPDGYSSVFTEVSFNGSIPEGIDDRIIKGLLDMDIIKSKKDIVLTHPMVLKDAYVIYNEDREALIPVIKNKLESSGIYTAGRYGNWEYGSMEDAILQGFEMAEKVR